MTANFIKTCSSYVFQFALPTNTSDIALMDISKNYAFSTHKNEIQHLVIIKRLGFQENISMNHTEIWELLKKYNLENYASIILDKCCNDNN